MKEAMRLINSYSSVLKYSLWKGGEIYPIEVVALEGMFSRGVRLSITLPAEVRGGGVYVCPGEALIPRYYQIN
jgi:hypothetical protein